MSNQEPTIKDLARLIKEHTVSEDERFEKMDEQFSGVIGAISDLSTHMDGQFNELKSEIKEIRQEISSINTRLDSIEREIQNVREELRALAKKDQEDSDALNRGYANLEKRIMELERQVKQLRQANQPHFA